MNDKKCIVPEKKLVKLQKIITYQSNKQCIVTKKKILPHSSSVTRNAIKKKAKDSSVTVADALPIAEF